MTDPARDILDPLPPLPTLLRRADKLSAPTLVIDTREQTPLVPIRLPFIRATLATGDYSVAGAEHLFAVERKSIADLVGCCKSGTKAAEGERERFERELARLSAYCVPGRFGALLIIGTVGDIEAGAYRSEIHPRAVLNSLKSWQMRFGVWPVFRGSPAAGAAWVEERAWWFVRSMVEAVNGVARAGGGEEVNGGEG
jgi:ERCC4-type nuclease